SNAQDYNAQLRYTGISTNYWSGSVYDYGTGSNWFYIPYNLYGCFGLGNTCSEEVIAQSDIYTMRYMDKAMLPNGAILVRSCGDSDNYQCVVVAWNQANKNSCTLTMSGSGPADCYIMQVKVW